MDLIEEESDKSYSPKRKGISNLIQPVQHFTNKVEQLYNNGEFSITVTPTRAQSNKNEFDFKNLNFQSQNMNNNTLSSTQKQQQYNSKQDQHGIDNQISSQETDENNFEEDSFEKNKDASNRPTKSKFMLRMQTKNVQNESNSGSFLDQSKMENLNSNDKQKQKMMQIPIQPESHYQGSINELRQNSEGVICSANQSQKAFSNRQNSISQHSQSQSQKQNNNIQAQQFQKQKSFNANDKKLISFNNNQQSSNNDLSKQFTNYQQMIYQQNSLNPKILSQITAGLESQQMQHLYTPKPKPSSIITNFRKGNVPQFEEDKINLNNYYQDDNNMQQSNSNITPDMFGSKKNLSFYQSNNHLGANLITPTARKKIGSIISNKTVKDLLMKHQMGGGGIGTPGLKFMNQQRKLSNIQDSYMNQNSIAGMSQSDFDYTQGMMTVRHKNNVVNHQDFGSSYAYSQEPGGMYDSPALHEMNQFDNSRHENNMMNRATALNNNREQITRNVSELKKIKKKKKNQKRQDSFRSRKSSTTVLHRNRKSKGGLSRITNILRNVTFKKDFETTSNGSDTDQEEEDPMQTILVPFNMSFGLQDFPISALILLEIIMIFDIFVIMNCGYYTKGMLIMFILDFLAAIPAYSIYRQILKENILMSSDQLLTGNHLQEIQKNKVEFSYYRSQVLSFLFLQFMKVLKIIKFTDLQSRVYDFIMTEVGEIFFKAFKLSFLIFMVAHWLGCFFWLIGGTQDHISAETWIRPYLDLSLDEQYVNSIYWAITTMVTVGYGDIHPTNTYERLATIVNMLVASGMYAYIINEVATMVRLYNTLATKYEESMKYVNKFMKQKGIPEDLRTKIVRYLEYNWEQKKKIKIEEREVYGLLNENLRDKITLYLNGKILRNIQIFESFSIEFISRLTFVFKKQSFAVDEIIFNEDTIGQDMFFISSGKVYIIHKKTMSFVKELYKDDHFGEIGFFSDLPRQATIKARDYTDTMILSKENFLKVAGDDFLALKQYYSISCSIDEQTKCFTQLYLKCYLCGKFNHIFSQCPKFSQKLKGNLIPLIVKSEIQKFREEQNQNIFQMLTKSKNQKKPKNNANRFFQKRVQGNGTSPKGDKFENSQRGLLKDIKDQNKNQEFEHLTEDKGDNFHQQSNSFDFNNEDKLREHIQMQLLRKNQEYNKVPHNSIKESLDSEYQISSDSQSRNIKKTTNSLDFNYEIQANLLDRQRVNAIRIEQLSQANSFQFISQGTFINNNSGDELNQYTAKNQPFKRRTHKISFNNDISQNQIIEENSSSSSSIGAQKRIIAKSKKVLKTVTQKFSSLRNDRVPIDDLLRMSGEVIPQQQKNRDLDSPFKKIISPKKPSKIEKLVESSLETENMDGIENFEMEIDKLLLNDLKNEEQIMNEINMLTTPKKTPQKKNEDQVSGLQNSNQREIISPLLRNNLTNNRPQTEDRINEQVLQQNEPKIAKNYTRLLREKTRTTEVNLQQMQTKSKNIHRNIKKRPKASRIQQKDLFSNKFFVEDFLEDINSATILESENLNQIETPKSGLKYAKYNSTNMYQQPLAFKRTLSNKGNIGVNPFNFINQSRTSHNQNLKVNISRFGLGDSSPLNSSIENLNQIDDQNETDSQDELMKSIEKAY